MKKAGIITFHRAENFGAVMQTFALQQVLRSLGAEAYVIDHRNNNIESQYHILNPSILWSRKNALASFQNYLHRFKTLKSRRSKKKAYVSFRNEYLNIVPESKWKECNILITGSDQVWNLHLTGGFDDFFFLNFPSIPNQKRISYAASSDKDPNELLKQNAECIKNALEKFDSLSVREDFLKDKLFEFVKRDIEVLPDPTLLLDISKYDEIAIKPSEKDYVCVYHMTPTEEGTKLAERIASEKGLKVVELFSGYDIKASDNICKADLSPEELLGYLRYADQIVTTSFHGVAFSVKFGKNFWVIDKGDNFRQRNILNKLGLNNRLIGNTESVDINDHIDYKKIEKQLSEMIQSAFDYLRIALK